MWLEAFLRETDGDPLCQVMRREAEWQTSRGDVVESKAL
jgi:hypothetical protein